MPSLILLSHGSRHPRTAATIEGLARATAEVLGPQVDAVRPAFLDFDEDRCLTEVARALRGEGAREAMIVPLLFSGGYHMAIDVPQQAERAQRASGVRLVIADSLGAGEDIARLLADRVGADAPDGRPAVLFSVGSSRPSAQQEIRDLADRVAELAGRRVEFVSATNSHRTIADVEAECGPIHLLPLCTAPGLLLDRAIAGLAPGSTWSSAMGINLAGIVAQRYLRGAGRACRSSA